MAGNPKLTCPHCGKQIRSNMHQRHVDSCPHNPIVWDRLSDALRSEQDPDHIVSSEDYKTISKEHGLPSAPMLTRTFGGWANVAKAFGLKSGARRPQADVYADELYAQVEEAGLQLSPHREPWLLNALPGERGLPEWNPKKKRWEPKYRSTPVYMLR